MTRFTRGAKVHMLLSTISVPFPASFFGAVTRTRECFWPRVQARIDMDRSQPGRWMVIVIWPCEEVPRQCSQAARTSSRASSAPTGRATSGTSRAATEKGIVWRFMPLTLGSTR
jgi:hypothetical protein